MTSPDEDQISLDDLFAAVGVGAPAGNGSGSHASEARQQKDTTEQDLLSALGIPHISSFQKKAEESASVDAPHLDEQDRHETQRNRARQWRQELEAAEQRTAAATEEPMGQPVQASVSSLPTLSSNSIQPFGSASEHARIGVLEGSSATAQPQPQPQPQPQSQPQQSAQPFVPQGVQPAQGAPQGGAGAPAAQMQPMSAAPQQFQPQPAVQAQGVQQVPPAAFQQAQQVPLQPLQPVDAEAAPASIQPMQAAPLPSQPLQPSPQNPLLQPLERSVAPDAAGPAAAPQDQPLPQPGAQQPTAGPVPQQAAHAFQNGPVAAWQQQMAQQVSAAHAAASEPAAAEPPVQPQPDQPPIRTAPVEETDLAQLAQAAPEPVAPPIPMHVPDPSSQPMHAAQQPEAADAAPAQAPVPVAAQNAETSVLPVPQQPVPAQTVPAQPVQPPAPGMPPAPYAPPVVQPPSGDALEDLERGQASSKVAHIVGGVLIFIAVVCVAFAVCLLTGIIDLSAINTNHAAQSSSADNRVSSQASPSATSSDDGSSSQPAMTSQSGSKAGQVVYSYVVRGVDGGTHEAVETATFGEDGKLVSSTLEIKAESQMDAEKLLDQLKQEFGESLTEGEATETGVTCTVVLPRDDLDRDSYTELLSTNAPEFKIVSQ